MANKYNSAHAILLNNGSYQLLPVSKAQLIEIAAEHQQQSLFGASAKDVSAALAYLAGRINADIPAALETAKTYTGTSINALTATITAQEGYVFSSITETEGKLTAYSEVKLDAANIAYNGNSNVESEIESIYATLAGITGSGSGSIQEQIANAIDDLTYSTAGTPNMAVVSVTETNGVIAPVQGNVNAEYINVDNTDNVFGLEGDSPATTVDAQAILEYLQDEINDLDESAATYAIEKRTNNLDANVKEQYVLRQTVNGTTTDVQVPINIYKDSQLLAAGISTTDATYSGGSIVDGSGASALVLVYSVYDQANDAWTEEVVPIPVADFFSSLTAGDGLTENNGVLNVVKSQDSENFLHVNPDSIEIKGVQTAINTAETNAYNYVDSSIAGLDSEIEAKTENGFSYVMTGVTEANGVLSNATYIGLTDENVKTTFTSEDAVKVLAGNNDVTDVKKALNLIAGNISSLTTGTLGDIAITDGEYVKASNASKNGTTYAFTIDDSALGNVATLHYDDLGSAEVASVFNSNPEVQGD